MTEFRRLLTYTARYRGQFAVALVAMVIYAAAQTAIAYIVAPVFDDVLPHMTHVRLISAAILTFFFLKGLGSYVSDYLMTSVGQHVVKDLRDEMFLHTINQSAAFFARRTSGQLISRLMNDVALVQRAVSDMLADFARESLTLVGLAGYLFYSDWRLALVCVVTAPLVLYPLRRLSKRVRSSTHRSQEEIEHLTQIASEGFTGHRIVKAFGAEAREAARFRRMSQQLYRTYMRITGVVAALPPLMEFIGGMAAVGFLWIGALEVRQGALTGGQFAAFMFAAFQMYAPIKKLSSANATLQQASAAAERIFGMLDTHTEVAEKPGAPSLPRLRQQVEFQDVGFAYTDDHERFVLRHVSFTVRAGQVIAIVGLSGAGKTTLVNLMPRFYDVTEGRILVDGVDIRDVTLRSLRDQLALVTQETVLFDDTIAANIAYGAPTASRPEIESAARAAHAHEFIVGLQGRYDAKIGERGQRLSGGQRQRLAIARAILKNCPLLVLDEATSSLDAESEQLVQDALTNLMRNRTTFVIAHRLSTVRRADLVVALEKGRVAEMGTHDELVNRPGGVYARLYALQMFDERDRDDEHGEGRA